MDLIYFAIVGLLGAAVLSGISLSIYARLPAAVIDSAEHGRYGGLADEESRSGAPSARSAAFRVGALRRQAA